MKNGLMHEWPEVCIPLNCPRVQRNRVLIFVHFSLKGKERAFLLPYFILHFFIFLFFRFWYLFLLSARIGFSYSRVLYSFLHFMFSVIIRSASFFSQCLLLLSFWCCVSSFLESFFSVIVLIVCHYSVIECEHHLSITQKWKITDINKLSEWFLIKSATRLQSSQNYQVLMNVQVNDRKCASLMNITQFIWQNKAFRENTYRYSVIPRMILRQKYFS